MQAAVPRRIQSYKDKALDSLEKYLEQDRLQDAAVEDGSTVPPDQDEDSRSMKSDGVTSSSMLEKEPQKLDQLAKKKHHASYVRMARSYDRHLEHPEFMIMTCSGILGALYFE